MQGPFNESYLPLGSLTVDLTHRGTAKEYIRQLDLRRGCAAWRTLSRGFDIAVRCSQASRTK